MPVARGRRPLIAVIGAGGQLGRAVVAECAASYDVVPLLRSGLDVADAEAVNRMIAGLKPIAIVNCAALTDTALCEREPELAEALNARAPSHLGRTCARAGAYLVHVSTNEVFDGTSQRPYAEDARTNPLNAYGRSKLNGERAVLKACPAALVVRAAWLYGEGTRNFVHRVRTWAAANPVLRIVTDEVATPTSCASLARVIYAALERRPHGVLHATNAGSASRYDWAREIMRLSGDDPDRVQPALLSDFPECPSRGTLCWLRRGWRSWESFCPTGGKSWRLA
jgi:dTDP-4-dehydrorhamnose reductase